MEFIMFFNKEKNKSKPNNIQQDINHQITFIDYLVDFQTRLSPNELNFLIANTNVHEIISVDSYPQTYLMLALKNSMFYYGEFSENYESKLLSNHWTTLIQNTNLEYQDEKGFNSLMYAFQETSSNHLKLDSEQWNDLIHHSDLHQINENQSNSFMIALQNQSPLSEEQWDYLIKNSDLKQKDKNGMNSLMYALAYSKNENIILNERQWDYIIKNSDLNIQNNIGWNTLMYVMNHSHPSIFNKNQLELILQKTNLKQIQQEKYLHHLLEFILDNKLDITTNMLDTIVQNIQSLTLQDKKIINTDFQYFVSEIMRTKSDLISSESKKIIVSLSILSHPTSIAELRKNLTTNSDNTDSVFLMK